MQIIKEIYEIISSEGFSAFANKIIFLPINRYCIKLMKAKQWKRMVRISEKLIKIFPKRIEFYHRLANSYKKLGNDELATETLRKGLENKKGLWENIQQLEKTLEVNCFISTKYIFMGGEQNLGCFDHKLTLNGIEIHYLTKISTISCFEKEKIFYSYIYRQFPEVREITPKLIKFKEISEEKLSIITMEKVHGLEPSLNKNTILKIMRANKIISSLQYGLIKSYFPDANLDGEFQLHFQNNSKYPITALHSFSSIHKETTNQRLFSLVYKKLKSQNYSRQSFNLFHRLEKVIIGGQLFQKILPDVHYSLQHGDFTKRNMLIDKKDGKLYIIDWGNMRIGPNWVDLAGFFGQLKLPFHTIFEDYLVNNDVIINLGPIEKIFFVYTLIITWLIVLSRNEFDELQNIYLRPAVESVESMAFWIMEKERSFQSGIIS